LRKAVSAKNEKSQDGLSFLRGNLATIAVSSAIGGFGAGIISIWVPRYFDELGGNPFMLGLMTSATLMVQCVMFLLGGLIADHYGRRKIIVLSAFFGIFFPLLYVVTQDWRIFAVLSIISALGAISRPASQAIVVDSIRPKKRTTGIASLQVISSLPVPIAILVGVWLIQNHGLLDGFRLACIYAAVAALTSAFVVLLFLKETLRSRVVGKLTFSNFSVLRSFMKLPYQLPTSLKALIISYALIMFANGAVGQYYILYAHDVIRLTDLEWGLIVSLQFLLAIVLKIPGGHFSDKFGKRKIMIISAATCAPSAILFTFSRSFVQALIVALLIIVTGIYYAPAHVAFQADLTPRAMRGRISALWDTSNSISAALGALMGGFLFQTVNPAAPFYLFAAVELMAALFLVSVVREPVKKEV
jgi:MFS family permease